MARAPVPQAGPERPSPRRRGGAAGGRGDHRQPGPEDAARLRGAAGTQHAVATVSYQERGIQNAVVSRKRSCRIYFFNTLIIHPVY